ncbi:FMN-dependent NADH-azoreductase [Actinomadura rubteroloni]|uniref:FMN-dependent NADH-azoreductase n=1 Tax=Actinomadura rubteroloni TaxID=1926885 RepID=A0A2P4UPS1_9ACTN|nr:NAD(P)H-dependent oxidoreductase [Actinomadura rubteroloni]POM27051.1 FMN-dependent NADH-azoreductase [Actinomadura rubteroloni]
MTLFRLDASIFPATSAGAEIADIVSDRWIEAHPGETVVRRHLGTAPLPAEAWADATVGAATPEADRTPAQREALALAASLADELKGADAVVLAVPLYNYGVSQHFKTWTDLVITAAGPTDPVLKDVPTVLVTTKGGGYGPGTPREGWDHSTPYLRRVLADMWGADLTVIERELTLAATNPQLEPLRPLAAELHGKALDAAYTAGKALAGK